MSGSCFMESKKGCLLCSLLSWQLKNSTGDGDIVGDNGRLGNQAFWLGAPYLVVPRH